MSQTKRKQGATPKAPPRNRGDRSRFITKRSLNGGKFTPFNDPPQLAYQPWNHITLAWYSGPKDTNFGDLVNQLKSQIDPLKTGFNSELAVQMKIHSIRVWNITGKHVSLTVYDYLDDDNKDQLCGYMDAGSNTGIPRLGYELPLTFRHHVMRNDSVTGKRLLLTTSSAAGDSILHYVRLEWRFDGPVKGPTIDLDWERRTFELQRKTLKTNEKTAEAVQKLLDAQPSTIERIISGVTHHAAEVAMLAEDKQALLDIAESLRELSVASTFDTLRDAEMTKRK